MRLPPLLALALALALTPAGIAVDDSLVHASRAQVLLGSDVWSQIIRIENSARSSAYPRTLHALVFELSGVLWFYTDVDGTQSFSLHRGRVAEEKADFAPLLRDIDPGFQRWAVVEADLAVMAGVAPESALPNGCFIESYAALRRLVARGVPVSEPRLLSYYARRDRRQPGHTVLAYLVPGRVMVIDPDRPGVELRFAADLARDPKILARAVQGPEVMQARITPVELPTVGDSFAVAEVRRSAELMQ